MEVIRKIADWRITRNSLGSASLGLVPTMGALHQGHLALVKQALRENALTLVSIFVNPAQFNDPDDLERYPRNLERDLELLRSEGVDYVFTPGVEDMYPDNSRFKMTESELSSKLCGQNRPGHFDGVLTVVLKLFNIITPQRAYFGEKDYQQLLLIEGMARSFFLPIEVVSVPIVREEDGLAMSSRNQLLSREERALAGQFPQILRESAAPLEARAGLLAAGIEVDYIEELHSRRFGAVRIGNVRLIDNVPI